ncbi:MAG: mevalonate kinase [Candidatus Nitrosotenuis sp.]
MKSIASAPGKVILFGEHFIVYGGKAVLCSIDKRITVESALTDSGKIEVRSSLGSISCAKDMPLSEIESTLRPIVYIAQKILSESGGQSGITINVTAEFPSGIGLGSSSACCVAAASSIVGLFSKCTKEQILELAIEAERTIFENTSGADCSVCTYGGLIEYHRDGQIVRLDFEPRFSLVIADSKMPHSTSQVVARVKKYKDENPAIFSLLRTQEERLIDDAISAMQSNDLALVGRKMSQNQKYLDQIGVSNSTLDAMLNVAYQRSYGAKITGAGDGGCIIAIVDDSNQQAVIRDLLEKGYDCFAARMDLRGVQHQIDNT